MFKHIFVHNFKMLLKNRILILWMLLFPILLGSLFKIVFVNLSSANNFEKINVGVVTVSDNPQFYSILEQVSDIDSKADDSDIFIAKNYGMEDAKNKLQNKEISAVIVIDDKIRLICNSDGIEQSIVKSFIDDYALTMSALDNVGENNPQGIVAALETLLSRTKTISASAPGVGNTDSTLTYFYALIAMVCLFFSYAGSTLIDSLQPCQSVQGARVTVSSISRTKQFLIAFLAYFSVCLILLTVFLLFIVFVLGIEFSSKWYYIILTALLGTLLGLTFGIFLSACIKKRQGLKIALSTSITLALSFFAGLMMPGMKSIVVQNAPIFNMLNPVAAVADCFYSIYYYSSISNFFVCIGIMCGYIALFSIASILLIRRKSYASI